MSASAIEHPLENLMKWIRQHPVTASTAAVVLLAALVIPHAPRTTAPVAELGPDETPLFI